MGHLAYNAELEASRSGLTPADRGAYAAGPAPNPQAFYQMYQRSVLSLTVGQAFALYLSPERGACVYVTAQRAEECKRILRRWEACLGAGRMWNTIRKADIRAYARSRLRAVRIAAVKHEVEMLRAVANWLRHEEELPVRNPAKAYLWSKEWKRLWAQYTPRRPRYSQPEIRGLRRVAWSVDPRVALMIDLVYELNRRSGHLRITRRSDIDAPCEPTPTPEVAPRGWLVIRGHPEKGGHAPAPLTLGAMAALNRSFTGHLFSLEETFQQGGMDYPLFPSTLVGWRLRRHGVNVIGRRELTKLLVKVEKVAGVEHIERRGFHGIRRRRTDDGARAGLPEDVLKALGGWKSWEVPRQVYQDQAALWAMQRAREFLERGSPDQLDLDVGA